MTLIAIRKSRKIGSFLDAGGVLPAGAPTMELLKRVERRQAGAITAVSVTTAVLARSAHPGITQAYVFVVFAVILVALVPLVRLVPEHHGGW